MRLVCREIMFEEMQLKNEFFCDDIYSARNIEFLICIITERVVYSNFSCTGMEQSNIIWKRINILSRKDLAM